MLEKIPGETLSVTHIFDGEEVVTGGADGQVWIATFAHPEAAQRYVERFKSEIVWGERRTTVNVRAGSPDSRSSGGSPDDRQFLEIPDFLRKRDG